MSGHFQVQIPTPCQEHWDNMHPEEKGRYCASCSKTVVDFTTMSDPEMIVYLARIGQHVCGRLAPDQLNRPLALHPSPQKGSWFGWSLLLAGMLGVSRLPAQSRPPKASIHQVRQVGGRVRSVAPLAALKERIAPVIEQDSLLRSVADSFKALPPVVVTGYATKTLIGTLGAVSVVRVQKISSWKQPMRDTLQALNLLPKKELTVYPNPARRGAAISLSWQAEPGVYQVGLFNAGGALIEQREVQVSSKTQVDLWEIPATVAAGVYFIRAVRPGLANEYTRKLVVW